MMFTEDEWKFIHEHEEDSATDLLLSNSKFESSSLRRIAQQIKGRKYAKKKLPSWYNLSHLYYPIHLSLEQCSSELTAKYKASLVSGGDFVDLTGGFGVDCAFIAESFVKGTYVERQTDLAEVVAYNYKQLGIDHISTINEDAATYLEQMKAVDLIYIDPARRGGRGEKLISIADCEPNVLLLLDQFKLKCKKLMIKLSPMLDLSLAINELSHIAEVHIVSVHNECKELIFILDFSKAIDCCPTLTCVNLQSSMDTFTIPYRGVLDSQPQYTAQVQKYLYEPNSAIMKAGAFSAVAVQFKINKLHANSHLYTSDKWIENFPGRQFEVVQTFSFDKKSLKKLKEEITKANLAIRNFPSTTELLRKKLKLKEGGDEYLFATTLSDNKRVLIHCRKINI